MPFQHLPTAKPVAFCCPKHQKKNKSLMASPPHRRFWPFFFWWFDKMFSTKSHWGKFWQVLNGPHPSCTPLLGPFNHLVGKMTNLLLICSTRFAPVRNYPWIYISLHKARGEILTKRPHQEKEWIIQYLNQVLWRVWNPTMLCYENK